MHVLLLINCLLSHEVRVSEVRVSTAASCIRNQHLKLLLLLCSLLGLLLPVISTPFDLAASAAVQTLSDCAAERNLDGLLVRGVVSDYDSGDQFLCGYHALLQAYQPARGGPFPHLLRVRVPLQPARTHLVRCRPCVQILQASLQLHFLVGSQNLGVPVLLHPADPIHTQAARALRAAFSTQSDSFVIMVMRNSATIRLCGRSQFVCASVHI